MPAKRILVVGGGSAGWISAAYLNAALNRAGPGVVEVSLVESPDVARIGVGEATVPTIRHILQTVGIDEARFLREADATFKQAIKFVDWLHPNGHAYYHPFDRRGTGPVDYAAHSWLATDRSVPFADTVSVQPQLCELGLSPRMRDSKDFASPMPYAYHMDAEKFADTLCAHATARGVRHIRDDVMRVERHADGALAAVHTAGGARLEAELFIDCTGFRGLLIDGELAVPQRDFSPWLLCDRAIAMRIPYDVYYPGSVRPYTTATALSSGWVWDIGLVNRRGTGYVYCSYFIDDDDAETELRAHEGAHGDSLDARRIRFRVGCRERFWEKNCVAIGLSGGFIEPLESTGLYLSEFAAVTLAEHFPFGEQMQPLADRFNRILSNRYNEVLDFVNMHYALSRRDDTPFWREVRRSERVTDSLREKLEFWKIKPPSASDFDDQFRLFSHQSYEYILYGMDYLQGTYLDRFAGQQQAARIPEHIAKVVDAARTRLPKHEDWLGISVAGSRVA
ncbi:MAG: tryptophan halogenase family protein [Pseudomonadota bacterium]